MHGGDGGGFVWKKVMFLGLGVDSLMVFVNLNAWPSFEQHHESIAE
jgi:hypothetical protein